MRDIEPYTESEVEWALVQNQLRAREIERLREEIVDLSHSLVAVAGERDRLDTLLTNAVHQRDAFQKENDSLHLLSVSFRDEKAEMDTSLAWVVEERDGLRRFTDTQRDEIKDLKEVNDKLLDEIDQLHDDLSFTVDDRNRLWIMVDNAREALK